jgi:hypothetical protein
MTIDLEFENYQYTLGKISIKLYCQSLYVDYPAYPLKFVFSDYSNGAQTFIQQTI